VTSSPGALPRQRALAAGLDLVRGRAWTLGLCAAMAAWSVVLASIVHEGYTEFRLARFDLGNMVQTIWSTTQGRVLEMTDGATGDQVLRLGLHVDPFLVLLAPLWTVWPSPLSLAFAQVVAVSLGALPVFWLGRRHLGSERTAGLLALAYLAYPWLAWSAVGAIHPVTFAIPLYLLCICFLDTNRLLLFTVCALLGMSTGELMGLPIVGLGIWYALARAKRLEGALVALAGAAWTVASVFLVVPATRGDSSVYYGFYDEVGGSPQGVLRMLFTEPATVLGALFESHDIVYLVWLALPLCGLFLLSPGLAAVGLPQLLANVLSDFRSMSDPRYHSVAAVVPFLMAASVYGVSRLPEGRRPRAAVLVLLVSTLLALGLGPWSRAVGVVPLGSPDPLTASHVDALRAAVALVPEGAPVAASNIAGAHLSARRYVFTLPVLGSAEWVVIDRADPFLSSPDSPILSNRPAVLRSLVRLLEQDAGWAKVFERESVLVFRRTGA
jgi:uncharacterized membrane protein